MIYEGFIADGISAKLGCGNAATYNMMRDTKLNIKTIRRMKREGVTLAKVLEKVDWSFIQKRDANIAKAAANGTEALRKYKEQQKAPENNDIAEIRRMITEIYDYITKPQDKVASGIAPYFSAFRKP